MPHNKYEYRIVEKLSTNTPDEYHTKFEEIGRHDPTVARMWFDTEFLNTLGDNGWEMCGTTKKGEYIFKRVVQLD